MRPILADVDERPITTHARLTTFDHHFGNSRTTLSTTGSLAKGFPQIEHFSSDVFCWVAFYAIINRNRGNEFEDRYL